jgi:hypothetical protein
MINPTLNTSIVIREVPPKGRGVFAERTFRRGETVIVGAPILVQFERTITSIQLDHDRHVELDEPARVINHCCTPNTGIRNNTLGGYDFIALIDIKAGEEVTWDYEAAEFISIAVAECHCGSSHCRGRTRGYKFLSPEMRSTYGEFIADYLKP